MFRRVPLAWKNLTHDKHRLAVAVGGIAFAVLLMFIEIGFQNALLDSTVKVVDDLRADILLVSKAQYALPAQQRFSRWQIHQARAVPGVAGSYPLYLETVRGVLNQPGRKGYPIRILAYHIGDPIFGPEVLLQEHALDAPKAALVDLKSNKKFAFPSTDPAVLRQHPFELSGHPLRIVGTFRMGTDFANDGNLIMSAKNFAQFFPYRVPGSDPLSLVELGVIQIKPGADVREVQLALCAALPDHVAVLTKREFMNHEVKFWSDSTPIGYIFAMGTMMGFIVGVIICYQIIYADIADHTSEFATLKAMGYRNSYFIGVVIVESLYLSVLGFIPGLFVSWLLYSGLVHFTGLLMILNVPRAALVLVMTMVMCTISGCLVMRKILSAEPAELF